MEKPETEKILIDVNNRTDISTILRSDFFSFQEGPPKAGTLEEVAAVGIHIMQRCQEGKKLYDLLEELGIGPPHIFGSPQDELDEAMRRFIEPALDFIEARLKVLTVNAVIESEIVQLLTPAFEENFPSTAGRLQKLAMEFSKLEEDGEWSNVGNSCRQILGLFTKEVLERVSEDLPSEIKKGDVEGILKHMIKG
ncbi:MAG: hypothetical protein ACE5IO_08530 [Thermoplasmata archaeon]